MHNQEHHINIYSCEELDSPSCYVIAQDLFEIPLENFSFPWHGPEPGYHLSFVFI